MRGSRLPFIFIAALTCYLAPPAPFSRIRGRGRSLDRRHRKVLSLSLSFDFCPVRSTLYIVQDIYIYVFGWVGQCATGTLISHASCSFADFPAFPGREKRAGAAGWPRNQEPAGRERENAKCQKEIRT